MIKQDESGLNPTDYALLQAGSAKYDWSVMAHRYNLEFSAVSSEVTSLLNDADVVWANDILYAALNDGLRKINFGATSWSSVAGWTAPSGLSSTSKAAIAADGDTVYLFYITSTGISRNSWNGTAWAGWAEIVTNANVKFIAAVSKDRVHFITYSTSTRNYTPCVADSGAPWVVTTSDIRYPYPITDFDAVTFNNRDVLVVSTQTAGALTAKYINNQVVKQVMQAGGLIGFSYRYGSWSDHFDIDVFDNWSSFWNYRKWSTLNVVNDRLMLTAYSSGGSQAYPIAMHRMYFSKDGRHWSRGEALPVPSDGLKAQAIVTAKDKYIYLYQRSKLWRSYSTLQTGYSPSEVQLDITNEISSFSRSHRDMSQVNVTLENVNDWAASSILNGQHVVHLVVKAGNWVDSPSRLVMVQAGEYEVDSYQNDGDLPTMNLSLVARDFMSYLTKFKAENFKNWDPQLAGGDEFTDSTGTGYGGLSHTANLSGAWKTENSELLLATNNKEGVAASTIASENWNGSMQTSFKLAQNSNNEYAGITFRMQDKDNLWALYYQQGSDQLHIIQRVAGTNNLKSFVGSLGWTTAGVQRFIRVEFRYSRIKAYTSTDGITWTERLSYEAPGYVDASFAPFGMMGHIAKGYSAEDSWSSDPGLIPSPIIPWPDSPGYWYHLPGNGTQRICAITRYGLARTTNFGSGAYTIWDFISWDSITGGGWDGSPAKAWTFVPDAYNPGKGWLVTESSSSSIYYIDIINRTATFKYNSGRYVNIMGSFANDSNQASADASFGFQNHFIAVFSQSGWFHETNLVYTTDNTTFTQVNLVPSDSSSQHKDINLAGAWVSSRTALKARIAANANSPQFYGSSNFSSWSSLLNFGFGGGNGKMPGASLHSPWDPARNLDESYFFFGGQDRLRRINGGSVSVIGPTSCYIYQPRNGISTYVGDANRLLVCAGANFPWYDSSTTVYLTNDSLAVTPSFSSVSVPENYKACAISGDNPNVFYFWGGNYGGDNAVGYSDNGGQSVVSQSGNLSSFSTGGRILMLAGW
jgi:hypothetical protein